MNLLAGIPFLERQKAPTQVRSNSWGDRSKVLDSNVNLFCWKRPAIPEITDYLNNVLADSPVAISFLADLENLSQSIDKHRSLWDAQFASKGDVFWEDVERLSHDFLSFSETRSGNVVLKIIKDNACTKYHTDGYSLRLFTTYYGSGTEWLPENATNRKGLGKRNELIVKDPSQVKRMETFEVGILKGEIPNRMNATRGIVHRSPEIVGSGEKRVILRVDI